jgi:hypothetical protein
LKNFIQPDFATEFCSAKIFRLGNYENKNLLLSYLLGLTALKKAQLLLKLNLNLENSGARRSTNSTQPLSAFFTFP